MLSPDMQRLARIYDYCVLVERTISRFGDSFEVFNSDPDFQQSIAFSIFQIGELGGKLTPEYRKATAKHIQWGPMKSMRNWVAHSYGDMDKTVIWETATTDIPALKAFCAEELSKAREE